MGGTPPGRASPHITATVQPRPEKLIFHYTTTPLIEVASDGETAKGVWIMTGLESGLTDPAVAENVPRAPFHENWISFAARSVEDFDRDLMYFGDDGRPKFMPPPDAPATRLAERYAPDAVQQLEPRPPEPYTTFSDTFEY